MTANEFTKVIALIRGAFPRMDRFNDADVKDVWYECLQDLEYNKARTATLNAIKQAKDFPPDIATIREQYKVLDAAEKHELGEIRRFYEQARSYYPGCGEVGYGWKEFVKRAKTRGDAEKLQNLIIGYVQQAEKTGDVIDFAECVKTVRYDNGIITAEKAVNKPVDERK